MLSYFVHAPDLLLLSPSLVWSDEVEESVSVKATKLELLIASSESSISDEPNLEDVRCSISTLLLLLQCESDLNLLLLLRWGFDLPHAHNFSLPV